MTINQKRSGVDTLYKELPKHVREPAPDIYLSDSYVFLDFETTNLDKGSPYNPDNGLIMSGWWRNGVYTQHTGSEYNQGLLLSDIEASDFLVAHNVKFELGWLERCGYDITSKPVFCTMIAEKVIAGNRNWRVGLDACLERRGLPTKGKLVSLLMKAGVCPSDIPRPLLKKYLQTDVMSGRELFLAQRKEMAELGLLPTQYQRCLFTVPLVDTEKNGMCLDAHRTKRMWEHFNKIKVYYDELLQKESGGINFKSPKQKVEFFFETLKFPIPKDHRGNEIRSPKTNAPTTKTELLLGLKARNKRQRKVLSWLKEWQQADSALTKNLNNMLACTESETDEGILTFSFNQTVTQTHRLSSNGKNFSMQGQNLPRIMKPLFKARKKGWKLAEIDQAQLEYRVAVFLGQDVTGMDDIRNKVDSHMLTAQYVFPGVYAKCGGGKSNPEMKEARQNAKADTFKPLYGGTSGSKEQKDYYAFFKEKHVGITAAQESWLDEVYKTRKLTTATGLTFYWEDAHYGGRNGMLIKPDGRPVDQSVCNYPVQSLATADITPIGVTLQWHLMRVAKMESFLVNTIHDSSIGEVHPNEIELYDEIGVKAFEDYTIDYLKSLYGIDFNVPLEAEASITDYWASSPQWEEKYLEEQL